MSDKLYEAFRIYLTEGLLGVEIDQIIEFLSQKGYTDERKNEVISAYMLVTQDPILKQLIPKLSSYDLNYVRIQDLYNERKREMESSKDEKTNIVEPEVNTSKMTEPIKTPVTQATPIAQDPNINPNIEQPAVDSSVSMANDINRYTKIMEDEDPILIPDKTIAPNPSEMLEETEKKAKVPVLAKKNPDLTISKINQVGYANIVLMSIIVIIIVAIICVFIFM